MKRFHPGRFTDLPAQVISTNRRPAPRDVALPGVKCGESQQKVMILNTKISMKSGDAPLLAEGIYPAVIKAVVPGKRHPDTGEVLDLQVEFTLNGVPDCLTRKYPARLNGRSPLRRETQAVLGRNLSRLEIERFNTDELLNRSCRVMVMHQAEGAGKPKARIKTVLAPEPTVVAAEPMAAAAVAA